MFSYSSRLRDHAARCDDIAVGTTNEAARAMCSFQPLDRLRLRQPSNVWNYARSSSGRRGSRTSGGCCRRRRADRERVWAHPDLCAARVQLRAINRRRVGVKVQDVVHENAGVVEARSEHVRGRELSRNRGQRKRIKLSSQRESAVVEWCPWRTDPYEQRNQAFARDRRTRKRPRRRNVTRTIHGRGYDLTGVASIVRASGAGGSRASERDNSNGEKCFLQRVLCGLLITLDYTSSGGKNTDGRGCESYRSFGFRRKGRLESCEPLL